MTTRLTYLADLVYWAASKLGYTNAYVKGYGGVWIKPNEYGTNFFWQLKWPTNIICHFSNLGGTIINSDLELSALVLQEAFFRSISAYPEWKTPISDSDNTPTVAWYLRKASTINLFVADLLIISYAHNIMHILTLSVFYRSRPLKTMTNDSFRHFDFSTNFFFAFFCSKYSPQSPSSWTMCHLPTWALSSVISVWLKQP